MRNNKATKADAVAVIAAAVQDGWTRKVETLSIGGERPFSVMVSLTKAIHHPNGYINISSHVIVSFSKGRRGWSVSIVTPRTGKSFRGLWNAQYALREMRETQARQDARNAAAATI